MAVTSWEMLRDFNRERVSDRRRRPSDVVMLVAFLGTPASELARIIGCEPCVIRDAGRQFTPVELDRLGMWLGAAWWRFAWRKGHPDASSEAAVREAASYIETLFFVPDDFMRDLSIAVADINREAFRSQ